MAVLLLARHGETDWNREQRFQGQSDPPLNDGGRRQARALAERLTGEGLVAIYASPLLRALETARIVGDRTGLSPTTDGRLAEIDIGSWAGLTRDEVSERFPEQYERWLALEAGWEDGETYRELYDRVVLGLVEIGARHDGRPVLVVTHGGPIRAAAAAAAGVPVEDARRRLPIVENCEVVRVAVTDGRIRPA